jgi:hypothetical protein
MTRYSVIAAPRFWILCYPSASHRTHHLRFPRSTARGPNARARIRDVKRALGAEDRGTIEQRDTYFEVARGGLKLREE